MSDLFVLKRGDGPRAIVALHGWSADHTAFASVLRQLPEDVTLYLVDQPGCGRSAPPKAWTTEAIAEPISAFIRSLPHDRVTVAGACSGAVVGMFVALQVPDRVERLIMIDPFLEVPWYLSIFTLPIFGAFFYHATFANPLGRLITNLGVRARGRGKPSITRGFHGIAHDRNLKYLRALVRTVRPTDAELSRLAPVVHLAIGERTFGAVRRSVDQYVDRHWPDAKLTVLEGAGHFPLLEAPKLVAHRLLWPEAQKLRIVA